jgi:GTP-binding protein
VLPVVAIVGRQNVGKSTLFNRIAGKRIAITHESSGVTRDRNYAETSWEGRRFVLVDTGGMVPDTGKELEREVNKQITRAIEEADVLLFLLDMKTGPTDLDIRIGKLLRESTKKVLVVVNKVDPGEEEWPIYRFSMCGDDDPLGISSLHGLGVGELLDAVSSLLPPVGETKKRDRYRIAVTGKPNVGKSSLVNKILGESHVIVTPIPGTTRDSIDIDFEWNDRSFTLVDTAGLRRKEKKLTEVDFFGSIRARESISSADVCLVVLDTSQSITTQDIRLIHHAYDLGKATLIIGNKWDLVNRRTDTAKRYEDDLALLVNITPPLPVIFVSALTGLRVHRIMPVLDEMLRKYYHTLQTSRLNDILQCAVKSLQPPMVKGKRVQIYYGVQDHVAPPAILLFTNSRFRLPESYARYLTNYFKRHLELYGIPLKVKTRLK